jgi:branched-chain amino acid transport system ATP-binding protein
VTPAPGGMLSVEAIDTYYGQSHVLFAVSLALHEGEVVCLLGRNGAGKTTTIRSIVGLTPPRSGTVHFLGEDIAQSSAHAIARKGIRCAFSEKRVFGELTVRENIELGRRTVTNGRGHAWDFDRIYDVFPVLKQYERRWAGTLSGGEQQMLCVARALMGNPRLLILDEPTIGLAPVMVDRVGEQIRRLKAEGVSILLAEQNVKFALELADRCYVIDVGEMKFEGTRQGLVGADDVVRRYLAV